MGNSNPPFAEGQKIVRTGPSNSYVKEGQTYTAQACYQCEVCRKWSVTLKECAGSTADELWCCAFLAISSHSAGYASNFAPIQRQTTEVEIEKEVLDTLPKIIEERSDVVKETVTNSLEQELCELNNELIQAFNNLSPEDQKLYAGRVAEMLSKSERLIRQEQ